MQIHYVCALSAGIRTAAQHTHIAAVQCEHYEMSFKMLNSFFRNSENSRTCSNRFIITCVQCILYNVMYEVKTRASCDDERDIEIEGLKIDDNNAIAKRCVRTLYDLISVEFKCLPT